MENLHAEHPSWCDRASCSVTAASRDTHFSTTLTMEPDPPNKLRATVRITKGRPVRDYPDSGGVAVELMMTFPCFDQEIEDEEYYVVLRGEHAYALGRMLMSAGRQVLAAGE